MSAAQQGSGPVVSTIGRISSILVGLIVFVVGIGLMIFVFSLTLGIFRSIEDRVPQTSAIVATPAPASPSSGAGATSATASPGSGSLITRAATVLALQLLALLVLGWIAALIAAKGAQMATAASRQPE